MTDILMYSSPWCGYCVRARRLLESKGLAFQDIDVSKDPAMRQQMQQRSGKTSVPQIWINDQHIGGCSELYAFAAEGGLDQLIKNK